MSAKAIVQGLEDSELIRIFLDFVGTHRFYYQKLRKEISYKCFQATWVLPIAKATGYGRTETQAYKNALKNLLELLIEDPSYVEYFSTLFNRPKTKDPSLPPKLQLKTEGHQPQEKTQGQYETYSRNQLSRPKQEVHHSKINLNRSMSQKGEPEVQQAKGRLKELQYKLTSILEQNKVLRERLLNYDQKANISQNGGLKKESTEILHPRKMVQPQKSQKNLLLGSSAMGKVPIPKLNLQVLPNYHKKSQKCLNEVLLAAYNDKHGVERVY